MALEATASQQGIIQTCVIARGMVSCLMMNLELTSCVVHFSKLRHIVWHCNRKVPLYCHKLSYNHARLIPVHGGHCVDDKILIRPYHKYSVSVILERMSVHM